MRYSGVTAQRPSTLNTTTTTTTSIMALVDTLELFEQVFN
jgi:hypothetical protein